MTDTNLKALTAEDKAKALNAISDMLDGFGSVDWSGLAEGMRMLAETPDTLTGHPPTWEEEVKRLRAENERLRKLLKATETLLDQAISTIPASGESLTEQEHDT